MVLWIGFAVLTAVVVAALLRPLLAAPAPGEPEASANAAVYRDQMAEIETERARGLIGGAEAEAARIEIARRLLAAADANGNETPAPARGGTATIAMVVAAALPVLAIAAYLAVGAPGQPGQPHAARSPASAPGEAPSTAQLIAKVEERLRAMPEDGRGWDVIAPVYFRLERYREAADAFQRALRLLGESPDRLAGIADSHILANDGVVTEAARIAFARLRELAPDRMEPRFWLAVAAEQDGRFDEAATVYAQLLSEGDGAAPWRPTVAERWREVRGKLGLATEPVPSPTLAGKVPASKADVAASGRAPALAKSDVDAVQAMPAEARTKMIEDMVAGLDQRLSSDGRDLEGWQRLIRAYTVLGRREDALAALARARTALSEEAQSLEALATLARSLGLAS
jgi:cytochrome c-type biogenesis protein CcmH